MFTSFPFMVTINSWSFPVLSFLLVPGMTILWSSWWLGEIIFQKWTPEWKQQWRWKKIKKEEVILWFVFCLFQHFNTWVEFNRLNFRYLAMVTVCGTYKLDNFLELIFLLLIYRNKRSRSRSKERERSKRRERSRTPERRRRRSFSICYYHSSIYWFTDAIFP